MNSSQTVRLWEVDFLRGVAIVSMIVFHMAFDLHYLGVCEISLTSGFWFYLARLTASLFLLLVGASLTLSYSRARMKGEERRFLLRLIKRSLQTLLLAAGITLATYIFIGRGFIVFGVLHLIAVSILLAYPLLRLGRVNLFLGLSAIFLGWHIQDYSVNFPWLIWLGLAPWDFVSVDYLPVFPWFGVILIGVAAGSLLYRDLNRTFTLPDLSKLTPVKALSFLGRHSLVIYILHQPALIGLIYLAGLLPSGFPAGI